eukprot:GHUV01022448.1.p1 GENE.GHUV01022448.1~~GHUV01022448.1.p1  ORF type:complete len:183 (+),score=14.72 GHUV01022448.1:250-798(+)
MECGPTLYKTLGVSLTAQADEIRAAYRRLARQWHPDRHRGDDLAKRRFQQIQEAYEVLMDTRKRQSYDLKLVHLLPVEVSFIICSCCCHYGVSLRMIIIHEQHVACAWGPKLAKDTWHLAQRCTASFSLLSICCFAALSLMLQDYLDRFQELILTASGLDMRPSRNCILPFSDHHQLLLTAA